MYKLISVGAVLVATACATSSDKTTETPTQPAKNTQENPAMGSEQAFKGYLEQQVALVKPLQISANLAWYDASISGTEQAFARAAETENAYSRYVSDKERFTQIKAYRDGGQIKDPLLRRQLEVLYLAMLGKQVDPTLLEKITALEKQVEKEFNTYRGTVGGKKVSQNEIGKILRESKKSRQLKEAWQAQKAVGPLVAPKLIEVVRLRNQVAKALGFRDFYALRIAESEQNETELLALFDELDRLTKEPFLKYKAEIDKRLAKRLKIKQSELMPWHYQNPFFQEPPDVFKTGLDGIYQKVDTLKMCRDFFGSIDIEVDDIIARSDLYEKEGKTPHAFAADIDREGDIRILANIVPGLRWQGTMVHELGHGVYDKYIDAKLPWLLRKATHPLTTEGVAMMLDRLVGNPRWLQAMQQIDDKKRQQIQPEAEMYLAFAPLQFSRWTQVMLRFEREMYRDPDQDLNKLWWDLVEKYQGLKRPPERNAPDYASKIHLVIVPVYYHNYMMGELFGAQVHEAIAAELGEKPKESVYVGKPQVGAFLKAKVFAPGALYPWGELTEKVTGSPLKPDAFARRFADEK